MSQDRKQLHATLMAIPFYSNDRPSDDPQVRFLETPAPTASPRPTRSRSGSIPATRSATNSSGRAPRRCSSPRHRPAGADDQDRRGSVGDRADVASPIEPCGAEAKPPDSRRRRRRTTPAPAAEPAPQREPVGAITGRDGRPLRRRTPEPAPRRAPTCRHRRRAAAARADRPRLARRAASCFARSESRRSEGKGRRKRGGGPAYENDHL